MSFESSPGFFRSGGVTIACLNWGATIPVEREALTITVSMKQALQDSVEVGIGSSTQLAQVTINVINWMYVICTVIKMLYDRCCFSSVEACECSFKIYDYVSGHGLSVHPGLTVLLGRRAASVQNGRVHLSS